MRYDLIAQAARALPCPVLANGNIYSPEQALRILDETGTRGLMIGRGAIRNPWLFTQIRQQRKGEPLFMPTGRDLLAYIRQLWESQATACATDVTQTQRMKKFLNFIGEGVPGQFLHEIRRVQSRATFFEVCDRYLDHGERMPLHPIRLSGKGRHG